MPLVAGDIHLQVSLATDSGLSEDRCVNTFAFQTESPSDPPQDIIPAAIAAFYSEIGEYLGNTLQTGSVHTIKMYTLVDPEPRVPFYEGTFAIGGLGADALPSEVAICSSFAAFPSSGDPIARRRGRVFLGPLSTESSTNVAGYARVSSTARTDITTAFGSLAAYLNTEGFPLAVWSRADDQLYKVQRGWVNDAYDTQRRRGPAPTTRTNWTLEA